MSSTFIEPVEMILAQVSKYIKITAHVKYFGEESLDIVLDEELIIKEIGKFVPQIKEAYNDYMYRPVQLKERERILEKSIPRIRLKIGDYKIEAVEEFETKHYEESKGYKIKEGKNE